MRRLVLGTRGSALALWQARHVAHRLRLEYPGLEIEERVIRTEGDIQQQVPLTMGDRGVFVRRIEEALLGREIDLAVHSLKDLPTRQPDGLVVAAVPERHDPRDALLTVDGLEFEELAPESVLATGSFRRRAQLLHARPDLRTLSVRGNVDTRVRRLREGAFHALVLALAGVERLGISAVPARPVDPAICLPAVGQGALAVETREGDGETRERVLVLEHRESRLAVEAERAFLRKLGGGCLAPATAHARLKAEEMIIDAAVGDPDGVELLRDSERGAAAEGQTLGTALAARLLRAGAGELLERSREMERRGGER
jgi:hydroxymethylbilane synthase